MKKIAITSLTFSIISLIIVFSIYMPKFKPSTTLNSTDIYQQKNVELFPELKNAIYLDTAQYYSYDDGYLWPLYLYSVLNNIPTVGFYNNQWVHRGMKRYEYFNAQNKTCYRISYGELQLIPHNEQSNVSNEYPLSEISTYKCDVLKFIKKKIIEKDTLLELGYHDSNQRYHRLYTLKKENGDAARLVGFDFDGHSLNIIRIASSGHGMNFEVNIATEYKENLNLNIPIFEGKTTSLKINFEEKEYNLTAIVSDSSNISESCLNQQNSENFIRENCHFTLTAPFKNCNLELNIWYDKGANASISPIIEIKNDIQQIMQCLNIW